MRVFVQQVQLSDVERVCCLVDGVLGKSGSDRKGVQVRRYTACRVSSFPEGMYDMYVHEPALGVSTERSRCASTRARQVKTKQESNSTVGRQVWQLTSKRQKRMKRTGSNKMRERTDGPLFKQHLSAGHSIRAGAGTHTSNGRWQT